MRPTDEYTWGDNRYLLYEGEELAIRVLRKWYYVEFTEDELPALERLVDFLKGE